MAKPTIADLLRKPDELEYGRNVGTSLRHNIDKTGHVYHVITQSQNKRNIFNREVASYRHNLLCKLCVERGIVILFSTTMPNHTHEAFLTPCWDALSAVFAILDCNVTKYIRKTDKEGKFSSWRRIFDYCPKYIIVKDMINLLYLGKYIYDNPEHLRSEGRPIPDSCFWMFERGHFVVPYYEKIYERLFGLTYRQIYELYTSKTKKEVLEYARRLYSDWTEEDNRKVFFLSS